MPDPNYAHQFVKVDRKDFFLKQFNAPQNEHNSTQNIHTINYYLYIYFLFTLFE